MSFYCKTNLITFIFYCCVSFTIANAQNTSTKNGSSHLSLEIVKITTRYSKGLTVLKSDNFEKAYDYFNEGLSISRKIKNDSLIAKGNYYASSYFEKKKNFVEAIASLNEAVSIYEKLNQTASIIQCQRDLADINYSLANYEKATFHNFEALKHNERINDKMGIAEDLTQIGVIYLSTKDLDNAKSNFEKALELYQTNNNQKGIVDSFTNLGVVYQRHKDLDKALYYFQKALDIAEKNNLKRIQSILLGNIGSTNRDLKNYKEALKYLFQALAIKKEMKRYGSAAHSCNDIAKTYVEMNDYKNAKEYALKAVDYGKNNRLNQTRFAYSLLAKCNYELGNYNASQNNWEIYNKLNDSIYSISKAAAINELQIQYDTEKRDLKIKQQESNIAYLDAQNKAKNQLLIFGGLGVLLLVALIMLYRSRSHAKKQQKLLEQFSQGLIEAQENERSRVARELHDGVSQQLMMITRKSKDMEDELLEALATDTLDNLRTISYNLHPSILEQLGFTESVKDLIIRLNEQGLVKFKLDIDDVDNVLTKEVSLHVYRLIQEASQNILKHSNAVEAEIILKKHPTFVALKIEDNGIGFEVAEIQKQSKGLGMKSIKERCNIIKAQLNINASKNKGTLITVTLP